MHFDLLIQYYISDLFVACRRRMTKLNYHAVLWFQNIKHIFYKTYKLKMYFKHRMCYFNKNVNTIFR